MFEKKELCRVVSYYETVEAKSDDIVEVQLAVFSRAVPVLIYCCIFVSEYF